MTKVFNIVSKGLSYLFIGLATLFILLVWTNGDDALISDLALQDSIMDPFLLTAYVAIGIAALSAVIFSIVNMAANPKNAVKILIILAGLIVLAVITYSFAGNDFDIVTLQRLEATAELSRQVGAALYYTYIIGAITVVVTIFASIAGLFKK